MRVRSVAASAHAVVFFCVIGARAETMRPVHVDYQATRGCPDESEFVAELRARVPEISFARDDAALGLEVRIRRRTERFEGRVIVRDRGASSSHRIVEGETCGEVVAAVTLIAALTVDRLARVAPVAAAVARDANDSHEGTPPAAPPERDAAPPIHESVSATSGEAATAARPEESTENLSPSMLVGAHVGGSSRLTGTVLPSGVFFVDLRSKRQALVAPGARLRLERSVGGTGHPPISWTGKMSQHGVQEDGRRASPPT